MASAHRALVSGQASEVLWEGVAETYARDLRRRSPSWLIGLPDGPLALAQELARATRKLAPGEASQLYRAGGRAMGWALATPLTALPEPGAWRAAIPLRHHDAFRSGLETRWDAFDSRPSPSQDDEGQ